MISADPLTYLLLTTPGLYSVKSSFVLLLNKLVYIIVSFATAFKNKKQRIKNQWICFLLQLTILMPYFGAVLLWTTIFDAATIPTFGFAFFTAGYLKPQRMWSAISPVEANPNQKVSDAHLY